MLVLELGLPILSSSERIFQECILRDIPSKEEIEEISRICTAEGTHQLKDRTQKDELSDKTANDGISYLKTPEKDEPEIEYLNLYDIPHKTDRIPLEPLSLSATSALYLRRTAYMEIRSSLIDSVSVEIVGLRKMGKSSFLLELLEMNSHLSPVLILTKSLLPEESVSIYTATSIERLAEVLSEIVRDRDRLNCRIVGIDTLSTIFSANEDVNKEDRIFFLLKVLNTLGIRVIVVSSLIRPAKRTSTFYSRSILFKSLSRE